MDDREEMPEQTKVDLADTTKFLMSARGRLHFQRQEFADNFGARLLDAVYFLAAKVSRSEHEAGAWRRTAEKLESEKNALQSQLEAEREECAQVHKAIAIAYAAHEGQVDKAGLPYILHPLRLMMQMDTNAERMVALLHDVVEDNADWSFARLYEAGIPNSVVSAVHDLTRGDESYRDYIAGLNDPLTIKVKLADLADNMDPSRLALIKSDPKREERTSRYREAHGLLTARAAAIRSRSLPQKGEQS